MFDSRTRSIVKLEDCLLRLYVCGITPYKSTHLGHAFTYVGFDTLFRLALDSGRDVLYIQNISDIDEPLFQYAEKVGIHYKDLARTQTKRFFEDMHTLECLPPGYVIPVSKVLDGIKTGIEGLISRNMAYKLPNGDVYFDSTLTDPGKMFCFDRKTAMSLMLETDTGKNPFDPLLWRGRGAEPQWEASFGAGRPAWHISCAVLSNLQTQYENVLHIYGGGRDLAFPHHEFTNVLSKLIRAPKDNKQQDTVQDVFMHTGLVSYMGDKMSKSKGNLVFISQLREQCEKIGLHHSVIRLALLQRHYREDWEWQDECLDRAASRFRLWKSALQEYIGAKGIRSTADQNKGTQGAWERIHGGVFDSNFDHRQPIHPKHSPQMRDYSEHGSAGQNGTDLDLSLYQAIRFHLCNDLDTPKALDAVDSYARKGTITIPEARAVEKLLGIPLTRV
ncbi:cysteine--tRNA ligase [Tropheryma whipplei]|uniref:cysteine--tRNA ligase n=1 Tax=Tropheryma whipplei TaxID=2039 RepID=UPI0004B2A5A2|nr:cysteine--tRNA ligase [Tropheryma whipplei]MCO8182423.1 cysteine--tRNA ligase [Tropheryma whipplei]